MKGGGGGGALEADGLADVSFTRAAYAISIWLTAVKTRKSECYLARLNEMQKQSEAAWQVDSAHLALLQLMNAAFALGHCQLFFEMQHELGK